MIQSLYTPHPISEGDLLSVKDHFFTSFANGGTHQQAIETIHQFFSAKGYKPEVIREYSSSYFDWFVSIVWENPWAVSIDIWPSIVAYTYPTATAYGYDCLSIYLQYAVDFVETPERINAAHASIKKIFATSSFPLSLSSGIPSISYEQVTRFIEDESRLDSMQKAEFLSAVERNIAQTYKEKFIITDGVHFSDQTQSLLFFWRLVFQISELDSVAVRFFWNQVEALDAESKLSVPDISEDIKVCLGINLLLKDAGQPEIPIDVLIETVAPVVKDVLASGNTATDAVDLRTYMNTATPQDIIETLDNMATKLSEPRIHDVYYYNETTGKFEWDEALLRELGLVPQDFDMSGVHKKE